MRQIEFRAWDKMHKRMCIVTDFNIHNEVWLKGFQGSYEMDACHVEIMQKLSLKDKNGKSIYEGDILEKQAYDGQEYMRAGVVVWDSDGFCLKLIKHYNPEQIGGVYSLPYQRGRQINMPTVIGNIYENPELLEEKNE